MTHTSREYAEALYELAAEQGQTEAWGDQIQAVEDALAASSTYFAAVTKSLAVTLA